MQIPSRAGHIALLVILGSAGLALGCLVRVSARQFPLLFLQGTNLLMTFGMSIVLSFWAPSVTVLWGQYLANMLLVSAACQVGATWDMSALPNLSIEAVCQHKAAEDSSLSVELSCVCTSRMCP
jgi:hypothetical protein